MAGSPNVEIEGLNKLLRALEKLDEAAKDNLKEIGFKVGELVAQQAREEVPVLSGALRGTIRPARSARGAKVRAGCQGAVCGSDPFRMAFPEHPSEPVLVSGCG